MDTNIKYDDFTFEKLGDDIEICISTEHRFGTDAFLLADFAKPRHKDSVCDFCTGSGIIALLMHKNSRPKHIFAIEIQQKAHQFVWLKHVMILIFYYGLQVKNACVYRALEV